MVLLHRTKTNVVSFIRSKDFLSQIPQTDPFIPLWRHRFILVKRALGGSRSERGYLFLIWKCDSISISRHDDDRRRTHREEEGQEGSMDFQFYKENFPDIEKTEALFSSTEDIEKCIMKDHAHQPS